MKGIMKLAAADLRTKKGAFIGIALLMMMIVVSFTGTVSNNDDLVKAVNVNFEKADCGDLLIQLYSDMLSDDIRDTINNDPHIERAEYETALMVFQKPRVNGEEKEVLIELSEYKEGCDVFNDEYTAFLTGDNTLHRGEIYIPYKMRSLMDKGDVVTFSANDGTEFSFTVKGIYQDPIFGAMTVSSNRCVISPEDHADILKKASHLTDPVRKILSCTDINIHTTNDYSPYELKKELNDKCSIIDLSLYSPSRDELEDNIMIFTNVGIRMVFVYIVLLVAVVIIIMANSISSNIEMDHTDLGILRSQGFTKMQIRVMFVIEYTLALAAGAAIGLILSFPACKALIRLFMRISCTLTSTEISAGKCAVLSLLIILVCMGAVFIATAKISKISPVRAISGSREDVYFDSRLNIPVRKPVSLFIAFRQITSDLKNYVGAILMIGILVFFLISISVFVNSFDSDAMYTEVTGDIEISNLGSLSLSDHDSIEKTIRQTDSGAYLSMMSMHRMEIDGQQVMIRAYSREEDLFKPTEGRAPRYDNEVMITKSVSRSTGKEIGDSIQIKYVNASEEFVITGYFQTVREYGVMACLTADGIRKMDYEEVSECFVTLSDLTKTDEIIDSLNSTYDMLSAGVAEESETVGRYKGLIDGLLDIIGYVIYSVSILFAAIIVAMMTRAAFLRERTDIGIYKAVGMTSFALRLGFAVRFLVIGAAGSLLGGIMSAAVTKPMLGFMLKIAGITELEPVSDVLTVIMPIAVVCAGIFTVACLASGKIKKVEVRELITE
ncbi:MAG: FtsX-like permease family protein [Oscillospiraceae bacterium]|nr:FtsX-like permease family protein [Oscillospiraceae bacterium]